MLNLNLLPINQELVNSIKNRTVHDVTEDLVQDALVGPFKLWTGSTDEEFFAVSFINGIISIGISEREMLLNANVRAVAVVNELTPLFETPDSNQESKHNLIHNYLALKRESDIATIKFKDITKILHWKLKKNTKLKTNDFL